MIVFPIEIQTLSIKLVYSRLNSMRLKVQPAQIPNQGEKTFSSVLMGRKWPLSEIGQSQQEGVRNTQALLFGQLTDFLHVKKKSFETLMGTRQVDKTSGCPLHALKLIACGFHIVEIESVETHSQLNVEEVGRGAVGASFHT